MLIHATDGIQYEQRRRLIKPEKLEINKIK